MSVLRLAATPESPLLAGGTSLAGAANACRSHCKSMHGRNQGDSASASRHFATTGNLSRGSRPQFRSNRAEGGREGHWREIRGLRGGEGVSQSPLKGKAFSTFRDQNPPFELRPGGKFF
jgi:hypothetical protein